MEIEHQQQVGNQPRQELEEYPVWISGQEMIHIQMPFPPGEEGFDLPSQGEHEGDLFGRQIGSIGGNPVDFAPCFEADQKEGVLHGVGVVSESDFGEEKDRGALGDRPMFEDLPLGVFSEAGDEVFALVDPGVKALVVDIAPV